MSIKINCLISNGLMKSLFVNPDHTMKSINRVIGNMYTLIFQGTVVEESLTVKGYKMKDGDCIFAVNSNDIQQINKWKTISSDKNSSIMERVNRKNALALEKERVRINDISLRKIELNSRRFRKYAKKAEFINEKTKIILKTTETKYTKPNSICSTSLPIFW